MSERAASQKLGYRPDIDGLRAVAVLGVLWFHAGLPGLSGGYVGVDVFFVISGYLITSIVLREQTQGTFSFVRFYERRARRILPALVVMLLSTSVVASWLFLPTALKDFGRSVAATALSASNVLFWQEDGYFATSSELKPLLHTWSLSIEEQFYLLHPALLLLVRRASAARRALALGAVLFISLIACIIATGRFDFAYYLLPTRAWELLCGALLAAAPVIRLGQRSRELAGALGLSLIVFACTAFTGKTQFPGYAALAPCFGAALLIFAGASGEHAVGRVLSSPAFVWLGRRSYSAYLWHWPLLVLPKYYLVRSLTPFESVLALAAALLAAELSYRFVETPFRENGALSAPRTLGLAAGTLSLIALAGVGLSQLEGFPQRVSPQVRALEHAQLELDIPDPSCLGAGPLSTVPKRPGCFLGSRHENASFVLWGDSHGAAISLAVAHEAAQRGRSGLVLTHNGCPSLIGATLYQDGAPVLDCQRFATQVMERLERAPEIETVFLASRWSMYVHGYLPSETAGDVRPDPVLWDGQRVVTRDEDRAVVLEQAMILTAKRLKAAGKRVFVVDPIPEIGEHVPTTLARLERFHDPRPLGISAAEYTARSKLVLGLLERLSDASLIARLSPEGLLCDRERCAVRSGEVALYADEDHLSHAGALLVAPAFAKAFQPDSRAAR